MKNKGKRYKKGSSKIAFAIEASGIRKNFIAFKLGVDNSTVTKWCKGLHTPPEERLLQLAALLHRDISELK